MAPMEIDAEQRMRDIIAAESAHDVEKMLSFFTDDIFYEEVVVGGAVARGKDEWRPLLKALYAAIPDYRVEMTSYFISGNRECTEWIVSGTHRGDLPGLPATGKSFSIRGVTVKELREGKISRASSYYDRMSMLQQFGLLPSTPQK